MKKTLTFEELNFPIDDLDAVMQAIRWLERGDGIAVYDNIDFNSATFGSRKFVSFGSSDAQLETDEPPEKLPDIGNQINWRYHLVGVYRAPEYQVKFGTLHPDGSVTNTRAIKAADIKKCPYVILMPEHYREDGSCRCNDPEHTEMSEWGYHWDGKEWTA